MADKKKYYVGTRNQGYQSVEKKLEKEFVYAARTAEMALRILLKLNFMKRLCPWMDGDIWFLHDGVREISGLQLSESHSWLASWEILETANQKKRYIFLLGMWFCLGSLYLYLQILSDTAST